MANSGRICTIVSATLRQLQVILLTGLMGGQEGFAVDIVVVTLDTSSRVDQLGVCWVIATVNKDEREGFRSSIVTCQHRQHLPRS